MPSSFRLFVRRRSSGADQNKVHCLHNHHYGAADALCPAPPAPLPPPPRETAPELEKRRLFDADVEEADLDAATDALANFMLVMKYERERQWNDQKVSPRRGNLAFATAASPTAPPRRIAAPHTERHRPPE